MTDGVENRRDPRKVLEDASLSEMTSESNVVYQAIGFLSEVLQVPADTALSLLQEQARAAGADLSHIAGEVIARRRPLPPLPPVSPGTLEET